MFVRASDIEGKSHVFGSRPTEWEKTWDERGRERRMMEALYGGRPWTMTAYIGRYLDRRPFCAAYAIGKYISVRLRQGGDISSQPRHRVAPDRTWAFSRLINRQSGIDARAPFRRFVWCKWSMSPGGVAGGAQRGTTLIYVMCLHEFGYLHTVSGFGGGQRSVGRLGSRAGSRE